MIHRESHMRWFGLGIGVRIADERRLSFFLEEVREMGFLVVKGGGVLLNKF